MTRSIVRAEAAPMRPRVSAAMRVLAFIHIALASAGLFSAGSFCMGLWLLHDRFGATLLAFALPIGLFFSIFLFLPELAGGIALLLGKGWGRIIIFLLSTFLLLVFPLGTMLGGFGIWALLPARSGGSAVLAGIAGERPDGAPAPRIGLAYLTATLLFLVAVGAAGVITLALYFGMVGQEAPPAIADSVMGAIVTLPTALLLSGVAMLVSHRIARDCQAEPACRERT